MTAGPALPVRSFWMRFLYRCEACGYQVGFLLEEGCEGPHDGLAQPAFGRGNPWPRTASGRLIVPVPFIAGACPRCATREGAALDLSGKSVLVHSDWERDAELRPRVTELERGQARFHYPDDPQEPQACGIPIYPPHMMRGFA